MKLELKHLAPYLPYGLKIKTNNQIRTLSIGILTTTENSLSNIIYGIGHKPILRPLSDLTKEVEVNGEKLVPIDKLAIQLFDTETQKIILKGEINGIPYWVMQKLFEWHFDVFGLIEEGLAIDINTLKQ
jgi:hypothetical protein